jgi:hypothetical protein
MTESEWLNAMSPQPMLNFLKGSGRATDRKLRHFACACCRRVWELLSDQRSFRAVEVAEALVEGRATEQERRAARDEAWVAFTDVTYRLDVGVWSVAGGDGAMRARAVRLATYAAFEVVAWDGTGDAWFGIHPDAHRADRDAADALGEDGSAAQAAMLRDIFGTPHRPLRPLGRSLLGWNNGLLRQLAKAAYDERLLPSGHLDPARLAVLADALLDAGCDDDALLGHRRDGPHYRGCFAVDSVLGRE